MDCPRTAHRTHSFDAVLECEAPNSRIHTYTGTLHWSHSQPQQQGEGHHQQEQQEVQQEQERRRIPVDQAHLLLRGSTLRNTKWALGLVVYTGYDTKIVMNSRYVRVSDCTVKGEQSPSLAPKNHRSNPNRAINTARPPPSSPPSSRRRTACCTSSWPRRWRWPPSRSWRTWPGRATRPGASTTSASTSWSGAAPRSTA